MLNALRQIGKWQKIMVSLEVPIRHLKNCNLLDTLSEMNRIRNMILRRPIKTTSSLYDITKGTMVPFVRLPLLRWAG